MLDTWFSSALWPFATLGWPEETPELRAFYPTDVLVTGRDIIFLWVARMIMMGLEFTGEIPFSDVYIHSMIQAPDGRRMSKSLGTGIDPLDLIEGGPRPPVFAEGGEFPAYGADAVRWGLLAMSSAQDVRFSEEKVAQGQQLANKLWNAARLILLGRRAPTRARRREPAAVEDRWILSRLERARTQIAERIERYDFSHAALALYDFVYGELCDWYLELVKPRLCDGEPALAATLLHVLTETLALAHPMIPFVTEEIYSHVPGSRGAARGRACRTPGDAASTRRPRRAGAGDRGGAGGARLARLAGVRAARHRRRRGWPPTGYEETGEHLARLARLAFTARRSRGRWRASPVPGGTIEILPSDEVDLEGARRASGGPARQARGRDRARRAQARQRGLRRQGAAGGRRGRARQARAAASDESSEAL